VQLVDDLREGKEVTSTRGPRICTWKEAERVLAGYPDGRVDEGPGAGPASLAGLALARESSWTAPSADEAASESKAIDSGTAETKQGAAAQADTARAETETKQEESTGEGGKK
jgi:NADH-quinone oxidoreductase subunit E